MDTTTIRIERSTHEELKRLARLHQVTVSETVASAVRALRQEQMGKQLSCDLEAEEVAWLDADLE